MRQFWSPCSIVRYLDSFSICSTVFRPCPHHSHWCCYRIWWLSPPHWTMLEWPILRQFSSPCSIVRYLNSFQVPARYARYARQFSSPCSIVRYLDSFQVPARYAQYARQFLGLEWPILRQFSSPCSIVRYLDSFQVPARYARQFSSPYSIVRYLDSFQVPARYARQFLGHAPTTRTDVVIAYDEFPRHIGQCSSDRYCDSFEVPAR